MAPKSFIEVRSESWLNLTDEREREEVLIKELKKKYPKEVNSNLRHSIGSWQHFVANKTAETAASKSSTLSSSNNNKNEHLLIRLRQQSYLNRSSNSLSSNLSNSIDLTTSLINNSPQQQREAAVYNIPRVSEDEQDFSNSLARNRWNSDVIKLDEQIKLVKSKKSVLKEEPRRLKYLKSKLQGKGKQRIDNNKELNREAESPSLMRSLSSFSEKLNGKLGNFRHSWKHFLYNYNQQQQEQEQEQEQNHFEKQDEVDYNHNLAAMKNRFDIRDLTELSSKSIANKRFSECQEINKRQLTHDWLERYHKSLAGNGATQRSEMR